METNQRIELLCDFGGVLDDICAQKAYEVSNKSIPESLYNRFFKSVTEAHIYNGWFTEENIKDALFNLKLWLNKEALNSWLSNYNDNSKSVKSIGLIMAGNIPLVGFHDFLAVFLSGHNVKMKLSSDDKVLWPIILEILTVLNQAASEIIQIVEKLNEFDAVIATGSDNSATYFQSYFGKYPHIIRKNRTSIAILTGRESKEDLSLLGKDIFSYFGLGCRNVTQILVPEGYDMKLFFESIYDYKEIINHHKYANNYDYNKAIYLLNSEDLLDNNFLLVRRSDSLHSPIGVLFRHEYKSQSEIEDYLKRNENKIQVVVGEGYTPFGQSQAPGLMDYADGVDTLDFLFNL